MNCNLGCLVDNMLDLNEEVCSNIWAGVVTRLVCPMLLACGAGTLGRVPAIVNKNVWQNNNKYCMADGRPRCCGQASEVKKSRELSII